MKQLTLIILSIIFNSAILHAQDTTKYPWPLSPVNQSRTISGTFCEYRSTSTSGHYHNGVDIPAPAGTPVLAVLPGTVTVAYTSDPTGYDNYIRVRTVIDGKNKDLTYYHTNPVRTVGQVVSQGETISTIAIDHVHLIEYYLGNTSLEINAIRPDGGLLNLVDIWKPNIRTVRFFVDESTLQLPATNIGGKVDIIVHIQEVNGSGSSSGSNNGSYGIGYKILSADTQTVIYNPPSNSLRYQYYSKPLNDYVNYNYYRPEASTSNHVYILTNGKGASDVAATRIVTNNYWDAGSLPNGNYVVMIYTYDTRRNADTVYVPITKTDLDLIPPSQTNLYSVTSESTNSVSIKWEQNSTPDLKGHRLFFSFDNSGWSLRDNENVLTSTVTSKSYDYTFDKEIFFRITAVDTAPSANLSVQSDVYGVRINKGIPKTLIVDGFTRTSGSYKQVYHDFVAYYAKSFSTDFQSTSNSAIIAGHINLTNYDLVIWFLGDESTSDEAFSSLEQEIVKQYLRQGGKLFVTGSEIGYDLFSNGTSQDKLFFNNFLKSGYLMDNSGSLTINGEAGTLFQSLNFNYGLVSAGSPYNEDYPDALDTIGGSQVLLRYANSRIAAVGFKGLFEGGSKNGGVMVMGFPFETIIGQLSRTALMNSIFSYFDLSTSINDGNEKRLPRNFVLHQNYPNPFNPSTIIKYQIPITSHVKIKVYDLIGREVVSLVDEVKPAGDYSIELNSSYFNLSSGVYFYELRTDSFINLKKMVIIK
ncbi:MAG: T9SS type A sorting domain-containing protein [Ignavibacteria bacterium]|nr:T9SS type A sorting domain-containing protein [Ignavibacteria bacterium]